MKELIQKTLNRLWRSIVEFQSNKIRLTCILVLFAAWIVITVVNFPKDTYLSGWDNLHPEFNTALNLKRAFFGVWQEHQGLGHVGGHGYSASLPHTILIGIMSLIIPSMYVRSLFTFITLIVGALGCFFLISHLLRNKYDLLRYSVALIGSLFYMLNFATVQQFYVQLEPFIIQFAFLPWSFLLIFLLLEKSSKRLLMLFFVINILLSTQAFVPPLFVIYIISVSLILALFLVSQRSLKSIKKSLLLLVVIFCINAFWLLPFLHYVKTGSQVFLNATNNILSTQGWIDTNSKYGNLESLSILRGFPSQAIDEVTDKGVVYIFQPWLNYLSLGGIKVIGFFFFGVIIVGLVHFALSRRPKYELALLLVFFLTFAILATDIPILSSISALIQKIPLFRQSFRAGFTKLSITLALTYSVFFAFGVAFLIDLISAYLKEKERLFTFILISVAIISIFVFSLPIFQGHLFYDKAKLKVPTVYFEMFNFFKNEDPTGRVALLPQGSHWGWDTYRWGYTGSGFPWFGLSQPIMERAFDVWSNFNENYYWELSYALYSQNPMLLENVIEKYKIDWIVFDERLIPYSGKKYPFQVEKMLTMLEKSNKFELVKRFNFEDSQNESLLIFRVKLIHEDRANIQIASSVPFISQGFQWNSADNIFNTFGAYYSSSIANKRSDIFFPFNSLFSYRRLSEVEFTVNVSDKKIMFDVPLSENTNLQNLKLDLTDELATEPIIPDGKAVSEEGSLSIFISNQKNNQKLTVEIPKLQYYSSFDSNNAQNIQPVIGRCSNTVGSSRHSESKINSKLIYLLENIDSSTCFDIFIPVLTHKYGYIIMIESKNTTGNPLLLTLINATSKRNDFETILPTYNSLSPSYYVVPPMALDGLGYSLRLSNISIGKRKAVNELGRIVVYPIPYRLMTTMYVKNKEKIDQSVFIDPNLLGVWHTNPFSYFISLNSEIDYGKNTMVILNQGFDKGWKAYDLQCPNSAKASMGKQMSNIKCQIDSYFPFFFGKELQDHVLVDNWANGWKIDYRPETLDFSKKTSDLTSKVYSQKSIVIIFWPQYLEFVGFGLLILVFLHLLIKRHAI